ncbi:MAG: DNA alkylation repair protein [Candidatus Bathyarchaeota archaeon]|nr:MAG: DNA alkylation repair protein [Candidatus Bathyarchaeota archaeon]
MVSVKEVIDKLNARAKPGNVEGIARYGMTAECRLGISAPDMRKIAKELGKDHKLALELWQTRMPEAKIVARALGGSGMLGV